MLRGSPSLTPCFCWSTHSTCNLIAPAPASFFPTVLTILSLYSKQSSAPTIDFFLEVSKVNKAQFTWPDARPRCSQPGSASCLRMTAGVVSFAQSGGWAGSASWHFFVNSHFHPFLFSTASSDHVSPSVSISSCFPKSLIPLLFSSFKFSVYFDFSSWLVLSSSHFKVFPCLSTYFFFSLFLSCYVPFHPIFSPYFSWP